MVSPARRSGRSRGRGGGGDGALARARGRRPVRVRDAELVVADDEESAAKRVAGLLAEAARAGREIALTGGSTPGRAYELAAELEPDWSSAGVWWGDERCVPPDDDRSNFGLARRTLLDRLEAQPGRLHRIHGEDDPAAAAASYDEDLRGTTLDLVLLGLGPDGHVASLFPNSPGLNESERLAIPAQPNLEPFVARVTLTPRALRSARRIVFLVTGEQKAEAVASALGGRPDPAVPGSLIRAGSGETLAILDQKAASRLRD
ncbi:MAG: 6-phosphogluconolactonase [Actinobacteria bacterium]|nr:MAG: 6-phosphogluconolactonase [Actinomycetota bacterium]